MKALAADIEAIEEIEVFGRVKAVQGLLIEVVGPVRELRVGGRVRIETQAGASLACEIIGFKDGHALCLPFGPIEGVRLGCKAVFASHDGAVYPSKRWLGRVINANGRADRRQGTAAHAARTDMRCARRRCPRMTARVVGDPLDVGVRALNTFTTVCEGQRMGIFAGSGVGKSVLMCMLARNTDVDVRRDRADRRTRPRGAGVHFRVSGRRWHSAGHRRGCHLGRERADAAPGRLMTLTLAEYLRDQGSKVLCMMDSLTRFAMAQREIGLSIGRAADGQGISAYRFRRIAAPSGAGGAGAQQFRLRYRLIYRFGGR